MKLITRALLFFLLVVSVKAFTQTSNNFIIIDEIADNVQVLEKQFEGHDNVYKTKGIETLAIGQISKAIKGKDIKNLEIYVATKPGAMVFSSAAITSQNVNQFSVELKEWKNAVSNNVIIYSDNVFSGENGMLLKQKIEEITGLVFTTHK